MTHCKNCNSAVTENFCPYCGQKTKTSRITIPKLISDLPHAVFHVDKGILYNFIQLLKRPGAAIQAYIDGKRKPFFHPVSFLVLSLVFNYIVVKITDLHFYDEAELTRMTALEAQAIREYDAQQWWFLEHTYIYILIAIPISTLFIYLVLKPKRPGYNMAEAALIVFFTIAEGVILQSLIYLCFGWIESGLFRRSMESVVLLVLTTYAARVLFQILTPALSTISRLIVSVLAGFGLLVLWIGSAYALYYFFG